ncbi:MAG: metal-dependent hydrolase [Novosphingobium sp.]|jgi:predicted metal-dependent hydrolase|nr:metal-dependent hydrolase [Novosphingobium sp.]
MSVSRTPENLAVVPRNIRFDVTAARDGHWLGGDPVGTAVFNAMSLTFPLGERLFMDAVRAYRHKLSGRLAQQAKDFIAQESIHSREHHNLNGTIDRSRYPVERIEAEIAEQIGLARSAGPMRMLVVTICLEHFTAMLADIFAAHEDLFTKTEKPIRDLWRWHSMEESEHKAVAYDVFLVATKEWSGLRRWFRRSLALLLITFFFSRNISRWASWLLEADGYSPKGAKKAVREFLWRKPALFGSGRQIWLSWFKPGFHPWDHENHELMTKWQAEFDLAATN